MEKNISKEMFDMLTSTMWQDYKGYKRQLNLKSAVPDFILGLFWTIVTIVITVSFISLDIFDDLGPFPFFLPLLSGSYGISALVISIRRIFRQSKVDKVAFDIELSTAQAKIIRTKKRKYGIVGDCKDKLGSYLCLILPPRYSMIERVNNSYFIISKKARHNKIHKGLFNSNIRKITIPVRFERINRPNDSADLYVAEANGRIEKYNSFGDRIIR